MPWKRHLMIHEHQRDQEIGGWKPHAGSAAQMILNRGFRIARLDLSQPAHTDADIGGKLLLRLPFFPSPLFDALSRDHLDLRKDSRISNAGCALKRHVQVLPDCCSKLPLHSSTGRKLVLNMPAVKSNRFQIGRRRGSQHRKCGPLTNVDTVNFSLPVLVSGRRYGDKPGQGPYLPRFGMKQDRRRKACRLVGSAQIDRMRPSVRTPAA